MSKPVNRAGQHLFIGIPGRDLTSETRQWLAEVRPGGVILFARNVDNARQLRDLTRQLREFTPLIGIDQENNRVNRLREIVGELPALARLKATGGARAFGRQVGQSLRDLGINLDFAPVLDLELGDAAVDNALRDRCWGRTAAEVTRHAGEFLAGLREAGVCACGKHFPGLGGARHDSHEELPTIDRSRDELWAEDIAPYRELPLPAIMVSHAHYPAFDFGPASLSREIITTLLRRQLGYTGVVMTDDLEMRAIRDFHGAVRAAISAGADMLLVCHTPARILAAYEILARANIPSESTQRIHELVRQT
jgi:beta-N-acetylhexosaminidase